MNAMIAASPAGNAHMISGTISLEIAGKVYQAGPGTLVVFPGLR